MNEETTPTPPTKTPRAARSKPVAKPKRERKPVDPRILEARQRLIREVASIRSEDASARMLRVIIAKRLPKMTLDDKVKLAKALPPITPPLFPAGPAPAQNTPAPIGG